MKSAPARDSFRRKVEVLESWVSTGGIPEGEQCPVGPAALARWEDPIRQLTPWSNPNVAAPAPSGHYPDLRLRFDAAIALLQKPNREQRQETQSLQRQVRALAEQVAVLVAEHRAISQSMSRERQLKEIAQAQLAEARAELARIVPLR